MFNYLFLSLITSRLVSSVLISTFSFQVAALRNLIQCTFICLSLLLHFVFVIFRLQPCHHLAFRGWMRTRARHSSSSCSSLPPALLYTIARVARKTDVPGKYGGKRQYHEEEKWRKKNVIDVVKVLAFIELHFGTLMIWNGCDHVSVSTTRRKNYLKKSVIDVVKALEFTELHFGSFMIWNVCFCERHYHEERMTEREHSWCI